MMGSLMLEGKLKQDSCADPSQSGPSYVYMNSDPANDWALRERAHKSTKEVIKDIVCHLQRLNGSIVSIIISKFIPYLLSDGSSPQVL